MRDNYLNDVHRYNPNASKERIEALTLKLARKDKEQERRKKNGSSDTFDPELTLRPDLSKTLKKNTNFKYYHSGKWEKQPYEETEAWSCCMNVNAGSEGCVAINKDVRKWNLTSY